MSVLPSSNACTTLAGSGMATTWVLAGSTTAYVGTLSTDGYTLAATAAFVAPLAVTPTIAAETLVSGASAVGMGTCVETLTTAGAAQATTVTDNGNFAICHFLFYVAVDSGNITFTAASTGTTDWGVTSYLNTAQWGTAGSGIKGSTMNTSAGGTAITAATWGMALSPAAATGTTTIAAGSKVWTWYQPTQATTYAATALRRYGGGYNNSTADKVKAYCVSQRLTATTTNVAAGIVAASAVVTLSGASALAAGAIAFGAAALAI